MTERLEDFALRKKVESKKGIIKRIGIAGGGSMGQEISILVSKAGLDVKLIDISDERLQVVMGLISDQLDQMINRWGMTGSEKKAILSRISPSTDFASLSDCEIVIECVNTKKPVSNLDLRKEVFRRIEENVPVDTVIASNASTVLIADLSVVLKHPERSVGLHFISPVEVIPIIELNKCVITNHETIETINKFAKMLKKQIVHVTASPGNISTRLIVPLINEACQLLMEGVATVEDIDAVMMKGFGMPMGPFALADKIGLDKLLKWMEGLYDEFGDQHYKTSPLIKRMVRAKMYGKRVGEGFYSYKEGKRDAKPGSLLNLGREED